MTSEFLKKRGLNMSRGATSSLQDTENVAKDMASLSFFSYFFQMNLFSDWMFGAAIFAAILKDILDPIEVTGVLFVLVFVLTLCTSIFIGLMTILGSFSSGTQKNNNAFIKSVVTLLCGTIAEFIPGVNFIPFETATAIAIYMLVLSSRKHQKSASKA